MTKQIQHIMGGSSMIIGQGSHGHIQGSFEVLVV